MNIINYINTYKKKKTKTDHHMGIPHKILSENTYNLSSGTFFITTRYLLQEITTSSFESVPKKYTRILG